MRGNEYEKAFQSQKREVFEGEKEVKKLNKKDSKLRD